MVKVIRGCATPEPGSKARLAASVAVENAEL
jgi:hypothetical protein